MQNQNFQYSVNKSNLHQIIEHLTVCDSEFVPALSTQVKLDQYSQKIFENAIRFEAFSNNKLIGLIACYLNNYKSQTGFITNVSVISSFNGKGIAKQLLAMLKEYAAENNFNSISLEVNKLNLPALTLYKRAGFVLANEKKGDLQMTIQISNSNNKN
jgi:ribosomal protein S18 acetylase RimI-like enzyme